MIHLNLYKILLLVANYYDLTTEELIGKSRLSKISHARQVYFYLARKHSLKSYDEIAELVNRNHATAIHGEKTIKNLLEVDKKYKKEIFLIRENIGNDLIVREVNLLKLCKNYAESFVL
jgi:chromosomal replication initiator protein